MYGYVYINIYIIYKNCSLSERNPDKKTPAVCQRGWKIRMLSRGNIKKAKKEIISLKQRMKILLNEMQVIT